MTFSQDRTVRMFLLMAVGMALLVACGEASVPVRVAGGDAKLGQRLMAQYQCASCHAIPDVEGAGGNAGPPLEGFGKRSYIAGRIPNLPDRLSAWLVDPPAHKPGTLMPNMGVSPEDARHMAAYLYTLE